MKQWWGGAVPVCCFRCQQHVPVFLFYPFIDDDEAALDRYCQECIDSMTPEEWNVT